MQSNAYRYAFGNFRIVLLIFEQVIEITVFMYISAEHGIDAVGGGIVISSPGTRGEQRSAVQTNQAQKNNESDQNVLH